MPPQERLRGREVRVALEATRTRECVLVPRRRHRGPAVRTRLRRPRFGVDFDREPYSSAVHVSRSMNALNAQKLCVLAFDRNALLVQPFRRSRASAFIVWSRRRVRRRYSRRIRFDECLPSRTSTEPSVRKLSITIPNRPVDIQYDARMPIPT